MRIGGNRPFGTVCDVCKGELNALGNNSAKAQSEGIGK
jgi:hypothetical protein